MHIYIYTYIIWSLMIGQPMFCLCCLRWRFTIICETSRWSGKYAAPFQIHCIIMVHSRGTGDSIGGHWSISVSVTWLGRVSDDTQFFIYYIIKNIVEWQQCILSLSDMILIGKPCNLYTFFSKISANSLAEKGWVKAIKWAYLLHLSTSTIMVSFPSDFGNPSIKSIDIWVQACWGTVKGCRRPG